MLLSGFYLKSKSEFKMFDPELRVDVNSPQIKIPVVWYFFPVSLSLQKIKKERKYKWSTSEKRTRVRFQMQRFKKTPPPPRLNLQ